MRLEILVINKLSIIKKYFIGYFFVILLAISTLTIWLGHYNRSLFALLNSNHALLPDAWWKILDYLVDVRLYIYPIALIVLSFIFRRKKLYNVILLVFVSLLLFELCEIYFIVPRPSMVLPRGSFYWLGSYGDSDDLGIQGFLSERIGGLAVFSFAINELFFKDRFWVEFVVLLRVIIISIARVFTGWHWPLDVLWTVLISYFLVEICLNLNLQSLYNNFIKPK